MSYGKIAAVAATGLFSFGAVHAEETKDGRALVMESIEAHGGTEKWYNSGQLQFRWTYHMTDKGANAVVDTVQTVDPKSLAVKHEVVGKDITFGMNGGIDWIRPKDAEFMPPPRFWALTPTYFLGIPFVFNDENANFAILPDTLAFEGKDYTQVKVTYNPEAGDTPDDYYVLLIDPETKVTRGAYYTVTSDLLGNDKVGPPKFITLDDLQDIGGVKLSGAHRTFAITDDGKIGEQMRFTEVSGVKWLPAGTVDLAVPE
ncbi:MAG: hypothetical protein ABJQ29_07070 [Luteolibacter sp.]